MNMIAAVNEYNCPGCMHGPKAETCPSANVGVSGCANHAAATMMFPGGTIALGLPKGFNRFGPNKDRKIEIFESYDAMIAHYPNFKTVFSVPVWKHLDEHGNTIVRYFSPRVNVGWSCVILGNCLAALPTALEITAEQIDQMD